MWYAPPGTALDELMFHLHLVGVSCRGRLSSYSHWDSLSVPAHGRTIRTWCSASMGGLDPDEFEPDQATRLIELHNELGLKFNHGVLDLRVSSQYSQSLLALLEVCWRGPIAGAEEVSGTFYGPEDWQCDINGAHTAVLMSMEVVPVFGHVDEVEEYDDHDIEDWTLYKIELDALGKPDVFLNADVTPVFGRNYERYLDLVDTAARRRVTHFVRPSRIVSMCHIPTLAKDLLAHELGDPLLQDADCARKFKKGIFVRASGMLQQRYADRIDAVMATGCDEAFAVGGKIVPVLGEVDRVKAELRTGQEKLGIESLRTGDTYLCLDAERTWYRDGFWALGALILDETRLRVLEARNALESCGASGFSYQCDAVFFRGSSSVQGKMRLRFSDLRVTSSNEANPLPTETLSAGHSSVGWHRSGFSSMEHVHDAWRSLEKNAKRNLWPEICEAESPSKLENLIRAHMLRQGSRLVCAVTGEHRGAGKSYCATRAATAIFKTGLVLTPTNSLRTSFTDMPCGWSEKTADHQLGFYLGNGSHVRKTAGPIRTLKVDVIIIEEAAYMPLRTLRMILAAAHSSGTHVIGTYDTHQLQPVCDSSGMSISKDNVDRRVILENAFPICFHVFARKRDKTVEEQVEMDDGLLYILAAGDDSHEAQTRAIERCSIPGPREPGQGPASSRRRALAVHGCQSSDRALEREGHRRYSPQRESNIFDRERVSWVSRKVSSFIYADVTAGRLGPEEGGRHREALVQELLNSYGGRCNLCTCELVWAVYSERQPTLDRLDCSLPHTAENVDAKCLRCNRARGSLGRGRTKKKKVESSGKDERVREVWIQNFGAGHNAGPVKIEIRQLLVLIKKKSSTAKKSKMRKGYLKQLQTAWDRDVSFGKLDLPRKWSARRAIHSRKVSFTVLADIDDLLRKVRLLPPYVSRLKVAPEEKSIPRIKRQESL
ncbi:unnamed protein product [Ectocarpus sp. CCAP 1310/34]|nr:unnamed protein product [Ectocarpus sp. CCAP 1310/34]